ncbi:hypothetical protein [Bacillus sp. 2205SS5-2]
MSVHYVKQASLRVLPDACHPWAATSAFLDPVAVACGSGSND